MTGKRSLARLWKIGVMGLAVGLCVGFICQADCFASELMRGMEKGQGEITRGDLPGITENVEKGNVNGDMGADWEKEFTDTDTRRGILAVRSEVFKGFGGGVRIVVKEMDGGRETAISLTGESDYMANRELRPGKDIFSLKEEALTIFRRRKIGFVFQSFNLVPVLNVYENIVLPIELDGNRVDKEFVENVIRILGLKNKIYALPSQLSGGQQQRVAIARALASKPVIVLADEPTGNLDSATSQDVLGLMKTTGERFGQTMVMITHNEEIAQMADRIVRIEDGKIVSRMEQKGGAFHG